MAPTPRYFDIAVNLTDRMFHGDYNDKNYHPPDLEAVLDRAKTFNVRKMLVTGSSLKESELALDIASDARHRDLLYSTVGVHPCTVMEIASCEDESVYLQQLRELALRGKKSGVVKAFGEIGLDYDRLHYAAADVQREYFEKQLVHVACDVDLPLFLHMRAACDDFIKIIRPFIEGTRPDGKRLTKHGVVHSFTGSADELHQLLDLGFYIGVNGCSLKTEENLAVAKQIPLDRLIIETDSPWCEIRQSSAAFKHITPYPNSFYPPIGSVEDRYLEPDAAPKKKNGPNYKFDNFLPVYSIKRDQYGKFVESNLKDREIMPIGTQSQPLIKSRNEPCFIGYVAEVMSKLQDVDPEVLVETCWTNSCTLLEI